MFQFKFGIVNIFEYIGVVSFAILGAYVAMQKRMDLFGVSVLAFVSACGGGILRDMVMNTGVPIYLPEQFVRVNVPIFFSSYSTIILVMLSVAFVIVIRKMFRIHFIIVILDAIGLAVFAIDTGMKAIHMNYNFVQFLFVSVITAVGGGVIRDVLAQRIPAIFRGDIYALAAAAGSVYLWLAYPIFGEQISLYSALAIVFLTRMICVYFKVNLPIFSVPHHP